MTLRLGSAAFCVVVLAAMAGGCGRDARTTLARSSERAASWAAAVEFAAAQARDRQLPRAYMRDLLATAADNLDRIAADVEKMTDIDAPARARSVAACRRLSERLRSQGNDGLPDAGELHALEMELRASARSARDLSARQGS